MLMEGFPLDSPAFEVSETSKVSGGNRILCVASDLVDHRLFVCLDDRIADGTIAALQMGPDDIFICLDAR